MEKYLVYGADESPWVNDTFKTGRYFNNKPFYTNGEYCFIYKGCQYGAKWALTDNHGGCPEYSTATDGNDIPPTGWFDDGNGDGSEDTMYVARMNSITLSTYSVMESPDDDGSITDTLIISFFAPTGGNTFTGNNGDDFVAGGKVTIANLPEGLTTGIIRISDTTSCLASPARLSSCVY